MTRPTTREGLIESVAEQLKGDYSQDVWEEGALEFAICLKTQEPALFKGYSYDNLADLIYGECLR